MRLLPLILLVVCCSVRADWTPLAIADDVFWEYDPQKLTRSGKKLLFWVKVSGDGQKHILSNAFRDGGLGQLADKYEKNYHFSLNKWELNCQNSTMKLIISVDYEKNGNVLSSSENIQKEFSQIIPESLMDVSASTLCNPKKK